MNRIQSQIISLGGQHYAIPQENLKELVRIPAVEVKDKIDKVGSLPVIKLRQEFLPLLDLSDVLGTQKSYLSSDGQIEPDKRNEIADRRSYQHLASEDFLAPDNDRSFTHRSKSDRRTNPASAVNIAIVYSEAYKYGLVVDKFQDTQELDLLSSGKFLSGCDIYMGTSILKNDKAALVLDICNIANSAGLSQLVEEVDKAVSDSVTDQKEGLENYSLLTFKNSETEYFAVDIDSIERLERFKTSDFEKIGEKEVVQYRGSPLILFELSQIFSCSVLPDSEIQEVAIIKHRGLLAGLKVIPPVDTFDGQLSLEDSTFTSPLISGTIILNGKTTTLLDVSKMITKICRELR